MYEVDGKDHKVSKVAEVLWVAGEALGTSWTVLTITRMQGPTLG